MPSPALNKASMIALLCSRASLLKVETQLDGDQETNDLGCLSTFFLFFSFHFKSVRNDTPDLYRKLLYTSVFSHFMCMPWLWTPTICAKTNPHNSQPYCLRYLSHDFILLSPASFFFPDRNHPNHILCAPALPPRHDHCPFFPFIL